MREGGFALNHVVGGAGFGIYPRSKGDRGCMIYGFTGPFSGPAGLCARLHQQRVGEVCSGLFSRRPGLHSF